MMKAKMCANAFFLYNSGMKKNKIRCKVFEEDYELIRAVCGKKPRCICGKPCNVKGQMDKARTGSFIAPPEMHCYSIWNCNSFYSQRPTRRIEKLC